MLQKDLGVFKLGMIKLAIPLSLAAGIGAARAKQIYFALPSIELNSRFIVFDG